MAKIPTTYSEHDLVEVCGTVTDNVGSDDPHEGEVEIELTASGVWLGSSEWKLLSFSTHGRRATIRLRTVDVR